MVKTDRYIDDGSLGMCFSTYRTEMWKKIRIGRKDGKTLLLVLKKKQKNGIRVLVNR